MTDSLGLGEFWVQSPSVYVQGDRQAAADPSQWQLQIFKLSNLDSSEFQPIVLLLEVFNSASPAESFYFDGHATTDKYGRFALRVGREDMVVRARPHPKYVRLNHDKFELTQLQRLAASDFDASIPIF